MTEHVTRAAIETARAAGCEKLLDQIFAFSDKAAMAWERAATALGVDATFLPFPDGYPTSEAAFKDVTCVVYTRVDREKPGMQRGYVYDAKADAWHEIMYLTGASEIGQWVRWESLKQSPALDR